MSTFLLVTRSVGALILCVAAGRPALAQKPPEPPDDIPKTSHVCFLDSVRTVYRTPAAIFQDMRTSLYGSALHQIDPGFVLLHAGGFLVGYEIDSPYTGELWRGMLIVPNRPQDPRFNAGKSYLDDFAFFFRQEFTLGNLPTEHLEQPISYPGSRSRFATFRYSRALGKLIEKRPTVRDIQELGLKGGVACR